MIQTCQRLYRAQLTVPPLSMAVRRSLPNKGPHCMFSPTDTGQCRSVQIAPPFPAVLTTRKVPKWRKASADAKDLGLRKAQSRWKARFISLRGVRSDGSRSCITATDTARLHVSLAHFSGHLRMDGLGRLPRVCSAHCNPLRKPLPQYLRYLQLIEASGYQARQFGLSAFASHHGRKAV